MYYWFRTETHLNPILWLGIAITWSVGGWLLATHAFRLEKKERLVVGLGVGMVAYLWSANLLGHWLDPMLTFVLAGLLVFVVGITFAWRGEKPILDWQDLSAAWKLLVIGAVLMVLFVKMGKGLGIFDDRKNLSIISTMAAGDIPPHFYMNSAMYFRYHYGFQILGASLMRLGGLFPWSAFDLSKALVGAYGILLAYLLGRKYIGHDWGGIVFAIVLVFATGTRYLLLLFPPSLLSKADTLISLRYVPDTFVGLSFSQSLTAAGTAPGDPPVPFIFAYMKGVFSWPYFIKLQAGPDVFSLVILLLIWLIASRLKHTFSFSILTVLFSMWALAWEATYCLFLVGGISLTLINKLRRNKGILRKEFLALLLSFPIALMQGGTLTEVVRGFLQAGNNLSMSTTGEASIAGFSLRWPLAIVSSSFSPLRLNSPLELLVGIFELGLVILFVPLITGWAWKYSKKGDWTIGVLSLSAWVGFLIPIFLSYKVDHDITRFNGFSMLAWTLLLALLIWDYVGKSAKFIRTGAILALSFMVFGGSVISGIYLTAASRTMLTINMTELDARIAQDTWDTLPRDSDVFDPEQWRATVLTGRLTQAVTVQGGGNVPLAEWEGLHREPSVEGLLSQGYGYVYVDEKWWDNIPIESKVSLS